MFVSFPLPIAAAGKIIGAVSRMPSRFLKPAPMASPAYKLNRFHAAVHDSASAGAAARSGMFGGEGARAGGGLTNRLKQALRQQGFQEHHIISPKNPRTMEHELIELSGINLESSANKIFLPKNAELHPTRSIHSGRHTTAAIRDVEAKMNEILNLGKAERWSQSKYHEAVTEMLSEMRQELKAGNIALNRQMRPWANTPNMP